MQELEKMMGDLGPEEAVKEASSAEQDGTAVEAGAGEISSNAESAKRQSEGESKPADQGHTRSCYSSRQPTHRRDHAGPTGRHARHVRVYIDTSAGKCLNAQMLRFIDDVVEADRPRPWSNSAPAWKTATEPSPAIHPLVPPEKMQVILQDGSSVWMYLQKDEIVDVVEHVVAVPNGSLLELDAEQSDSPSPDSTSPLIFLRTVKAVDQFIPEAAKPMISNEVSLPSTNCRREE